MKKFCCLSLSLILLMLPLTSCTLHWETPSSDFVYYHNSEFNENEIGITLWRYIGTSKRVVVPSEIEGEPVTKIGIRCFENNTKITSVVLPETVRIIDGYAFEGCVNLKTVNLPKNLAELRDRAFFNCTSLRKIEIFSGTSLGSELFAFSGLEEVILHEGITRIRYSAFLRTNITEIKLPSTVEIVEYQAFAGCEKLTNVMLNEGLQSIESYAFAGNTSLTEIVIPSTVTTATEFAFVQCIALEKIKFEGDAPMFRNQDLSLEEIEDRLGFTPNYTIYYHEGAKGFATPLWLGLATAIW